MAASMELESDQVTTESMESDDWESSNQLNSTATWGQPDRKKRKRGFFEDENYDQFDGETIFRTMRRGGKEGRRISGVYREFQALHNIGSDETIMDLVFSRMATVDVSRAAVVSHLWNASSSRIFRRRIRNAPFLRLLNLHRHSLAAVNSGLMINWDLHYHEQLLSMGSYQQGQEHLQSFVPSIQGIISVGNRDAYTQLTHEDAKLPFRQDYIYVISEDAIFTTPNYSFTRRFSTEFPPGTVGVESLFIPQSRHFTMKGFGVELFMENWTVPEVRAKVELPVDDMGPNQNLKGILLMRHLETEGLRSFLTVANEQFGATEFLVGNADEIGCNRVVKGDFASAVGYALYGGPGARITVYTIDFLREDSAYQLILEMGREVAEKKNSFCFMFSHDTRPVMSAPAKSGDDVVDDESLWSTPAQINKPTVDELLTVIHNNMPRTPIIGVRSLAPVLAKPSKTNIDSNESHSNYFTFGFLVVSYDD